MKKIVIVFSLLLSFFLMAACSNEKAQDKSKSLTPEQKQAIEAEKKLEEYQKVVKYNDEVKKEIDQTFKDMVKNATMQEIQGKDAFGNPEKQWEYTFKNTSKFTFTMIQLGWTAVKKDGTTTKDYSDALNQVIKPNDTFKLHARLYSEALSYKDIFLQGNPAQGTYKDVAIPSK